MTKSKKAHLHCWEEEGREERKRKAGREEGHRRGGEKCRKVGLDLHTCSDNSWICSDKLGFKHLNINSIIEVTDSDKVWWLHRSNIFICESCVTFSQGWKCCPVKQTIFTHMFCFARLELCILHPFLLLLTASLLNVTMRVRRLKLEVKC